MPDNLGWGVTFLTLEIQQNDCPLIMLSSKGDMLISVDRSAHKKSGNRTVIENVVSVHGLEGIPATKYLMEAQEDGYFNNMEVRLLRSSGKNLVMTLTTAPTSMKKFYLKYEQRCIRVYPTIISGSREKWGLICESEESAKGFIEHVEELNNTTLGNYSIQNVMIADTVSKTNDLISSFREAEGSLTKGEKETLFLALDLGYYSSTKKVKLRDISQNTGKSKGLISRQLRGGEIKIMSSFLKNIEENSLRNHENS